MLNKIKLIIGKLSDNNVIKNITLRILTLLLPGPLFLKFKRKISLLIYKINHVELNFSSKSKQNKNTFNIVIPSNQKKKADLVICCAFTGRYDILEKSIMESLTPINDYYITWFLCGSSKEDLQFMKKMASKTDKVAGIIWRNNPLGEKWHYCVKVAGDLYDSELYAITGSDDILSSQLIQNIIRRHKNNLAKQKTTFKIPALYCTDHWVIVRLSPEGHFLSALQCSLKKNDCYAPLGAGRFYSKEFLQQVNFEIFDISREKYLDYYGYFKLKNLGFDVDYYNLNDGLIMSVKGHWKQMNSLEKIVTAESIELKDCTFDALEKLKNDLSAEIYYSLLGINNSNDSFIWEMK